MLQGSAGSVFIAGFSVLGAGSPGISFLLMVAKFSFYTFAAGGGLYNGGAGARMPSSTSRKSCASITSGCSV